MNDTEIQKMKDTGYVQLARWQYFWHYSIVYLLIAASIAAVIGTRDVYQPSLLDKYNLTKKEPGMDLFLFRYVWLVIALIFYYIQTKRLKFKIINVAVSRDIFNEAAQKTAVEINWKIIKKTGDLIIAKTGVSLGSWGERITIIRDDERILMNSICDPDKWPSVLSFGKNRENRKTFEQVIRDSIKVIA